MNQPATKSKDKQESNVTHKLKYGRFKESEFERNHFRATPEATHTPDDTLDPAYWCNMTKLVARTDVIEAVWEDNSLYAEYLVLDKGHTWVKVALLRIVDLTTSPSQAAPASQASEYEVKFINNHFKFGVVRKKDGHAIKQNLPTEKAAQDFMSDYIRTIQQGKPNK